MPTPTYTPLANITLTSSAASVTFSSISQAYRDLVLVIKPFGSVSNMSPFIRFNGSSTGYSDVYAIADGSATYSGTRSGTDGYLIGFAASDPTSPGEIIVNIMDYSATDTHKTYLSRAGKASAGVDMIAGRWANTAAVTSFTINANTGSFASGASFALYGVAA